MMVVVGILSGIAATSLSGLSTSRQDVAVTRLRSALIHAQLWAQGSGKPTWMVFDAANDRATLFREDPNQPGKANRMAMLDPLTRAPMVLQLGLDGAGITSVSFGATNEVHFDALGLPHDANGTPLTADGLVGITGGNTVRVTRNTGLVSVD